MRIIIAEDDPFSRRFFSDILGKWGYEVAVAAEGPEAWSILEKQTEPCIAILNSRLPQLDGLEIARRLKDRQAGPVIFVFLMAPQMRREEVQKAAETTCDDYLLKPADPVELRNRLRLAKRILDLETNSQTQSTRDPLTGTWNRDAITVALNNEVERARRQRTPMSVMVINIDKLRQVNEMHGAFVGDRVLSEVAKRVASGLRAYDEIGRLDGGQFVVVLGNCETEVAAKHANRICAEISAKALEVADRPVHVTVSIGISGSDLLKIAETDAFIVSATVAAGRAKTAGGNRSELARIADLATV